MSAKDGGICLCSFMIRFVFDLTRTLQYKPLDVIYCPGRGKMAGGSYVIESTSGYKSGQGFTYFLHKINVCAKHFILIYSFVGIKISKLYFFNSLVAKKYNLVKRKKIFVEPIYHRAGGGSDTDLALRIKAGVRIRFLPMG